MNIVEDAIQTYINFYGRIDRRDMFDFFGISQSSKNDTRIPLTKMFQQEWKKRNLSIYAGNKIPYSVSFPRIKEDQAEIVKIFREHKDGQKKKQSME